MARAGDVARTKVSAASPKSRVVFASRRRANGSSELALTVDERRSVRGARFEAPSREPRNRERRGTSREQPASPANTSEQIGWGERGASLRAPRKSERRTPVRREQACGIRRLNKHHKSVRASRTLDVTDVSRTPIYTTASRTLVVTDDRFSETRQPAIISDRDKLLTVESGRSRSETGSCHCGQCGSSHLGKDRSVSARSPSSQ